ncbi:3-keto-5-aminohexanoate cleavage protein [Thalassospiraceae bacterium LMO-JJ14]|nr:3-keto-5-aminohexanoate cleavage protein [Thalassospiraceae bacterium LMO-JJ14]
MPSTIISCAVTGSAPTPDKCPAVPVTPAEIAASAIDAAKAGAAIVHIHVRDPETTKPSMDPALYRETTERIRDSGTDVIINLTTGPGARYIPHPEIPGQASDDSTMATPERRVVHIEEMSPEICSLDVATMNFNQHVFLNHPDHLAIMAERARKAGAKPELEVFDTGHIVLAKKMIADGLIDAPPYFQFCLGISYAAPATVESMKFMRDMLPEGAVWSAFGISRFQFPMVAAAVLLGGNARVGLEDNIWLEKGVMAPSNAALVEKACRIVNDLGGNVASVSEARERLGLKG